MSLAVRGSPCMGSFRDLFMHRAECLRRGITAMALLSFVPLAGCAGFEVDWTKTGQLWLGALCDGASECSWDQDGDPYTRW